MEGKERKGKEDGKEDQLTDKHKMPSLQPKMSRFKFRILSSSEHSCTGELVPRPPPLFSSHLSSCPLKGLTAMHMDVLAQQPNGHSLSLEVHTVVVPSALRKTNQERSYAGSCSESRLRVIWARNSWVQEFTM